MSLKEQYTTGEVAELLGVSFQTVIRWIKRGKLRAHQLPGRGDNRIQHEGLLEFIKTNKFPLPKIFESKNDRILVVDDDPTWTRTITRVLHRENYEINVANNGFQAAQFLYEYTPHLVTLDLQMPGLSGNEVIKKIRNSNKLNNLFVLVISGLPMEQLKDTVKSGANDALKKPFSNQDLIRKVNQFFNH